MASVFLKLYISLALLLSKLEFIKAASDINICENVADHIFIQDINDCTKYFVCVDGQAKSQKCRSGLYFDATLQACITSPKGCLKCPARQMINLPLIKTCIKYILCYYGQTLLRKCENNQQFNRKTGKCDYIQNVDCVDDRCSIHPIDNNSIYMPSAASCENYYVCVGGQAKSMTCAAGLQFSTKCNCCDKAENVACMIEVLDIPEEISKAKRFHNSFSQKLHTPTIVGESKLVKCPPVGNFLYPYIGDPDYYFTCVEGKATLFACASGFQFDDKQKRCVSKVEEVEEHFNYDIYNSAELLNKTQCPEFGAAIMPHEENTKYILCVNGNATVFDCPANHYFDDSENVCSNNLEMKRKRYGSVVDEFAGIVCPKYATFTFPHQDKHKFYLCLDGKATVFTCADGQYFDISVHGCREELQEQEFNLNIIPLNSEEFDFANAQFGGKCPTTGKTTLPHAQKNQYYLCMEGKSAVFACAEGLLYDDKLKNCTENATYLVDELGIYAPETANIMCPKFGTFKFPHATKTKYYLCTDGKTYILDCAKNEYFDADINICRLNETLLLQRQKQQNNILKNNTPTSLTSVATELASSFVCPITGTFMFPHAQKNHYYVCVDGNAIVFTCTEGHSFDTKTNTCKRDANVLEEDKELVTPVVLDEPISIVCPAVGVMKFSHEEKHKFYLCINGMASVLACANGSFYDHESGACRRNFLLENITSEFDTEMPTTTFELTTLKAKIETFVKCPLTGTFIYPHNESNQYYVCLDGQAIHLTCPKGLLFDSKEKACRESNFIQKSLKEYKNIKCPLQGTSKIPHADPNKFFLCLDGIATIHSCAKGDLFDTESETCRETLPTENTEDRTTESPIEVLKTSPTTIGSKDTFQISKENVINTLISVDNKNNETNLEEKVLTELINIKCPPQGSVKIPNDDLNKFYLCNDGVATIQSCAEGDFFDSESETCRESFSTGSTEYQTTEAYQTTVISTESEETSPASIEHEETTLTPNRNEEIVVISIDNKEYETALEDKTPTDAMKQIKPL